MATRNTLITSRFSLLAVAMAVSVLLALGGCSGENESKMAGFLNGASGGSTPPPSENPTPPPGANPAIGNVTLSWNPPTERTDGTPLTLGGYRIVYGTESRNYNHSINLNNPGLTRYYIDGLGAGTWFFAIIAIDTQGLESPPSMEVSKKI
jgi:hypothetical protein